MSIFTYLREPLWLLLSLVPALFMVLAYLMRRHRSNSYAEPEFHDWVVTAESIEHRHRLRQLLFTQLAWLAFAVAIAGPRLPEKIHDTQQQYNKDVMVVIDVSQSMSARDLTPSRIERARLELIDLVARMQNTRLGIVIYAGRPHLLSPPTADKQALNFYLKTIRTQLLPTQGSALFDALQYTIQYFARQSSEPSATPRAIVLVTDAEVNLTASQITSSLEQLSQQLKQHRIHLFSLGTGTTQGAPLLTEQHGWLEHEGQAVISKLNSDLLLKLTSIGHGQYAQVSDDDRDWATLYNEGIANLSHQQADESLHERIRWQEKYHWFVIAGIVFLLFGVWRPVSRVVPRTVISTAMLPLAISIILLTHQPPVIYADTLFSQNDDYHRAYALFQQGGHQAAQKAFAGIPGYRGRFAEGSMAYQLEQYQQAIPAFIQAILDADHEQQRISAIFNLANCYFKLKKYTQAAQLYRNVLHYQANYQPARTNLDYAVSLIKENQAQEKIVASRQGKGPRMADAPEDMELSSGRVALGESESQAEQTAHSQQDPQALSRPDTVLEHSAPASEKIEQTKDETWTYDITSLSQLQQQNPRVLSDESLLWQRLFEVEENFEAALEQPAVIPGVKPW